MTDPWNAAIEAALDHWQEGLTAFAYGPSERERLTAILRSNLFGVNRPAPRVDATEMMRLAEALEEAARGYKSDNGLYDPRPIEAAKAAFAAALSAATPPPRASAASRSTKARP